MRTFIAIDIPPTTEIRNLLADFHKNMSGVDIKYTDLSNHHITLAFLGETTNDQVIDICKNLNYIKLLVSKIEIDFEGIGLFKNGHNPSVIWIGIKPNDLLQNLYKKVNRVAESHGFTFEKQKFSPHLTLGRIKRTYPNHNLNLLKAKYHESFFGKALVTEFVYYQSILTPQGPIYKPIQKFKL